MSMKVQLLADRVLPLVKDEKNILKPGLTKGHYFQSSRSHSRIPDLGSDIGGALMNEEGNTYCFRVATRDFDIHALKQFLAEKAEEMYELGGFVKAFFTGGIKYDDSNSAAINSYNIYNALADECDKIGIPFGMICGKNSDNKLDNLRINGQNAVVWGENFCDKYEHGMSRENFISALEDEYQIIEFPEELEIDIKDSHTQVYKPTSRPLTYA